MWQLIFGHQIATYNFCDNDVDQILEQIKLGATFLQSRKNDSCFFRCAEILGLVEFKQKFTIDTPGLYFLLYNGLKFAHNLATCFNFGLVAERQHAYGKMQNLWPQHNLGNYRRIIIFRQHLILPIFDRLPQFHIMTDRNRYKMGKWSPSLLFWRRFCRWLVRKLALIIGPFAFTAQIENTHNVAILVTGLLFVIFGVSIVWVHDCLQKLKFDNKRSNLIK